jgi:hydrogenase assembly chaperone HypC/HupF
MCLAFPGKVVALKEKNAIAVIDFGGEKREANNLLCNAKIGDWVLVQFKKIVEIIPEKQAIESLKEWKKLNN